MIKLSDYLFHLMSQENIKDVFVLPGGGAMHLVDSLGKEKGMKSICCLHEQGGAIAAEAYAQYKNDFGVVLVTTGPGSTNALTGVLSAWFESVPLLVISGQVKTPDMIGDRGVRQMGIQEAATIPIVESITKYAVTITEPDSILYHFQKAVYLAKTGRQGPVWLDIPLDVQGAIVDENSLKSFDPNELNENSLKVQDQDILKVIDLINQAERPVILAGHGIKLANAREDFIKLIETLNIPVLTTWKTIDLLPEDHPLFMGRPGSIASRYANYIQQNSDLFISIGARLDLAQTGYNHHLFARGAKKVIIDIDENEINKLNMDIDISIVSDAKGFIGELTEKKASIKTKDLSQWFNWSKELTEKYPIILPEHKREDSTFVNPYMLVDILSDLMKEGDVLVPGSSGNCSEIPSQAFRVKKHQRVINSPSLGAMGFGLPASIGVCIASGMANTVSIIGDGGFQLNIQELQSISGLQLPIKSLVLNNNGYGSIQVTQNRYFEGRKVCSDPESGLTLPDFKKIADAYGLKYVKIENHRGIKEKLQEILELTEPVLCEIMLDPDQFTLPKLSSAVNADGKIVSKPLEDLAPFLDRDEFHRNMLIDPVEE